MVSFLTLLASVALLAAAPLTDAHGVLSKPGLAFTGTAYGGDYSAVVPMSSMPPVDGEKYGPNLSWADIFGRAFKKSKYKSLREYLMANQDMSKGRKKNPSTKECGFTAPEKQTPQALPDKIEWYGGKQNHPGPCEAWCDDEIVLPYTVNCQASFPDGKFPYEKAKCVGKKQLSFYWMATLMEWQVYIDCSRIGAGTIGGGGGGVPANTARDTNGVGNTTANANTNNGNNNNDNNNNGNNNGNKGNNGNNNNGNNGNNNNQNRSGNNNNNQNNKSRSIDGVEDDAAVEQARSYNFGNLAGDESAN